LGGKKHANTQDFGKSDLKKTGKGYESLRALVQDLLLLNSGSKMYPQESFKVKGLETTVM